MTLHRLTTPNLPSIRVHDHHAMEGNRSMPLAIPAPRHGSPTSSRVGPFHGQPAPPPILSLDLPSIPPPRFGDNSERRDRDDGMRQRWPDMARQSSNSQPAPSPRGWGIPPSPGRKLRDESPGSFDDFVKREPSQSWPEEFFRRQKPQNQKNKELSGPALPNSPLFIPFARFVPLSLNMTCSKCIFLFLFYLFFYSPFCCVENSPHQLPIFIWEWLLT
jgi:hypothetical protein